MGRRRGCYTVACEAGIRRPEYPCASLPMSISPCPGLTAATESRYLAETATPADVEVVVVSYPVQTERMLCTS